MKHLWILLLMFSLTASASGRGRHKQLYVAPVPGPVTIDAKLDDWDLSGQILSYVVPETQDMQSARTAMMYDAEALYISCVVRDTSPMMNRHDPLTDPEKAWDADVMQIFFSLDPDEGYPVAYNKFNKDHFENGVAAGTMMLWHFTDREEACLSMYRGMAFKKPLRPDLSENGVIPHEHYQAAYRKQDDGGGYVLEYRIPWATIGVTRVPKANDLLALSLAVFWSRPDGLKTAGGAAWAYDVMSSSGFSFQSAEVWGKLIFWPENDIPAELVTAGLPPEKPLPLKFSYELPEDSEVSVQLYDADNQVVRLLVAQQARRAGTNTELWDGLDDHGKPLPAGTYNWKGIYHEPIKAAFQLSVHNSGQPPYPTDNNKGGWGGDHGTPQCVVRVPGGMVLSWGACEYGWGIIKVNEAGKKQWGSKHSATYMATDGSRLYVAGGHGFNADPAIQMLDLKDSRPISLPDGRPTIPAPDGGTAETNDVTGLDFHTGTLYVSYAKRDLVAAFNAKDGTLRTTYSVPSPHRLAAQPDGSVAVISAGTVVVIRDGVVSDLLTTHLDEPAGIEIAADGTIYVANRGALQDISVFSPAGAYLRSIGKRGGRPAVGLYDPSGLYMAGGMELDSQGRLWVAETTDSPKRISVWDTTTGANLDEFFGSSGYFGYGFIAPEAPTRMYAHNAFWEVDWETKTSRPVSTIWRKTAPDMMQPFDPDGYAGIARFFTATNGREYAWGNARHKSILMRRDGDVYKPFAAFLTVSRGYSLYSGQKLPLIDSDPEAFPDGIYFWQDRNADQTLQAEEIHRVEGRDRPSVAWVDADLTLWLANGKTLAPTQVDDGQPVYDLAQAQESPMSAVAKGIRHGYFIHAPDGSFYTFSNAKGPSLVKWSPTGEMEWYYADIVRWHEALNMPIVGPGKLWGSTGLMGLAGDYLASMTYFGVNHVYRQDGMYVAALLQDGRLSGVGADSGQPEGQNGQFVRLEIAGVPRYFIIHGGQDSRVWEVTGLDTVKDLPGGTYAHTAEQVQTAAAAVDAYQALIADSKRLTIARGLKALDVAVPVGRAVDSNRAFEARAAYDAENLYVKFDVTTPVELTNAMPEDQLIFRGGNLLDIQLGTDPAADPARKTPAAGDLRLLITRKDGKPFAMLYRPKVADFTGEPIVFNSPTGKESFDEIAVFEAYKLNYKANKTGFTATVTIPLSALGLTLAPGQTVKMDLGYIFGNKEGTRTAARAYAKNNSFTANVTNDIPHESRLEPAEWGDAQVE